MWYGAGNGSQSWTPDESDKDAYNWVLTIVAVLSAFASMFFICRYLFCKTTRHHLTELIQFRCLFDFLYSLAILVVVLNVKVDCSNLTLVIQIFASSSELYAFVLSVDVILAIVDPFTNFKKRRWIYFVFVIVVASGCGLLVWWEAVTTKVGSSINPIFGCDANSSFAALNSTNSAFWIEANVPAIALYLTSFGNLVAALCWLSRGNRLSDALAARRNAIKAGIRYLAGYFVYWILIRAVFLHIKIAETQPAPWEYFVHVSLISARGIVTLGLWALGTRPVRSCCGICAITTSSAPEGLEDTHTILRQELLFYTKLGITVSVKHARKQRARRRSGGT